MSNPLLLLTAAKSSLSVLTPTSNAICDEPIVAWYHSLTPAMNPLSLTIPTYYSLQPLATYSNVLWTNFNALVPLTTHYRLKWTNYNTLAPNVTCVKPTTTYYELDVTHCLTLSLMLSSIYYCFWYTSYSTAILEHYLQTHYHAVTHCYLLTPFHIQ